MGDSRLWRPAAQRRVRNVWGYIQAQQSAWSSASSAARSAATHLVNAYLSYTDIGAMDLGVLRDVEGIREKARVKLRLQQKTYLGQYLQAYDALVTSVIEMKQRAVSMRTYAVNTGGPLMEFTEDPVDGDSGDGGGIAVFATLPLGVFELLVKEIVNMFQKELKIKWLLAFEFCNLVYPRIEEAILTGQQHPIQKLRTLQLDEDDESEVNCIIPDRKSKPPSRKTLQVYLTALLAEVYINKDRIEEISILWSDEMAVSFIGSPLR